MKIFLGPAGIPIVSKGESTIEGVKTVANLGLNAMEIEFVQQVYLNETQAKEVGKIAKDCGVRLSAHAPYYINLCSKEKSVIEASKNRIIRTALVAEAMEADAIAIHIASYSELSADAAFKKVKQGLQDVLEKLSVNVKIGVEVMGKKTHFGSLCEVLKLQKEVKIIPYIDWGHLFVRDDGKINYGDALEKLKHMKHVNSHFTCVAKNAKGQYIDQHVPIIYDAPPFKPLAEEILKRKQDITIICETPLLEHDSLVMKGVFEGLGHSFD